MIVNVIANEVLDDTFAYTVMDIVFEEFPDANINQLGNVQEAITKRRCGQKNGIRKGTSWDNACIESFHSLIKRE